MQGNDRQVEAKCPYCGAILRSVICSYCGSVVEGFNENRVYNEFHTKKARSAKLSFWNTLFPLFFVIIFGSFSIGFSKLILEEDPELTTHMDFFLIFCGGFGLIALVSLIIVIYSILRTAIVSSRGIVYYGIVSGYSTTAVSINNAPVLAAKLLMNVNGEQYYIHLSTGETRKNYVIGDRVAVRKCGKYYQLLKNEN